MCIISKREAIIMIEWFIIYWMAAKIEARSYRKVLIALQPG